MSPVQYPPASTLQPQQGPGMLAKLLDFMRQRKQENVERGRESELFPAQLANLQARTGQAQRAGQPKARTLRDVQKEIDDILTTLKKDEGLLEGGLDESVVGMLKEQQGRLYKEMAGFLGGQYQPSQPATDPRWWRFDPDIPAKFEPFGETPTPSPAPISRLPGAAAAGVDWLGGATEPLAEKATGSLAEVAGGLPEGGASPGIMQAILKLFKGFQPRIPGDVARPKKRTDISKRAELKRNGWTDAQIDAALRGK